ncbi:hypothetical protein RND81_04G120200 [Saponaria officinalis]|uniref:Uncharacterized protein n=1 Tax=Saponaria officinalis TaxID=3572 RepID=A0AAW1LDS4_SAPOF
MASNYFPQFENELFYKYFNRLHEYAIRCRHPYQTWELCHVIYNGLNAETSGHVYSLSEGRFIDYFSYEEKWELFQYLAYDTEQWELANSRSRRPQPRPIEILNPQSNPSMSTEEMIRALVITQMTFQEETKGSIQSLLSQATQIAEAIVRLKARDESNLNSGVFEVRNNSEFDEPLPLKPVESHTYKECDVDDDDDGFWDDDEEYDSNFNIPSKPICALETPILIHIEQTHIENNCSLNGDLSYQDPLSVLVENVQDGVMSVACEVENDMLDSLDDVRDKLMPDRDLRNHTPPFEESMTIPLEEEGPSLDFGENKITEDEKEVDFEVNFTKKPLIPLFHDPYDIVSQRKYSSLYMIIPISNLTCKADDIDIKSFFEYSGAKIQLLHAATSIIHIWYQLFYTSYCHFSNMCASVFDQLLRALSCSANELALG